MDRAAAMGMKTIKVAGAEQVLRSTPEMVGMGIMGLGGLVAIVGGLLFVVVVVRAMRGRP